MEIIAQVVSAIIVVGIGLFGIGMFAWMEYKLIKTEAEATRAGEEMEAAERAQQAADSSLPTQEDAMSADAGKTEAGEPEEQKVP